MITKTVQIGDRIEEAVTHQHWRIREHILDFSAGPKVMAILNATPDSFSDGGRFNTIEAAIEFVEDALQKGAELIDVGGESTRPGGKRVSADEELDRVVPIVRAIVSRFDVPVSIDTSKSEVAAAAVEAGVHIVNDISGLSFDTEMAGVASRGDTGLIVMHSKGGFETMHVSDPDCDIVADVSNVFEESIELAVSNGVAKENICLDIGIGFSKTFDQNIELLRRLDEITSRFDRFPMLVGVSRKAFLGKITGKEQPSERAAASTAAHCVAILSGASIIRAHDVSDAVDAVKVVGTIRGN